MCQKDYPRTKPATLILFLSTKLVNNTNEINATETLLKYSLLESGDQVLIETEILLRGLEHLAHFSRQKNQTNHAFS